MKNEEWQKNYCYIDNWASEQFSAGTEKAGTYHELLPGKIHIMNCSCNTDAALLQVWNVRITSVWEHNLCGGSLHDLLQVVTVLAQHNTVMLWRYLHRHVHLNLSLQTAISWTEVSIHLQCSPQYLMTDAKVLRLLLVSSSRSQIVHEEWITGSLKVKTIWVSKPSTNHPVTWLSTPLKWRP